MLFSDSPSIVLLVDVMVRCNGGRRYCCKHKSQVKVCGVALEIATSLDDSSNEICSPEGTLPEGWEGTLHSALCPSCISDPPPGRY